eukprot:9101124-Pyramimonas_sp.AAC.1
MQHCLRHVAAAFDNMIEPACSLCEKGATPSSPASFFPALLNAGAERSKARLQSAGGPRQRPIGPPNNPRMWG